MRINLKMKRLKGKTFYASSQGWGNTAQPRTGETFKHFCNSSAEDSSALRKLAPIYLQTPHVVKAQRSDHVFAAENVSALCSPTLRTNTKTSCISVSRSRLPAKRKLRESFTSITCGLPDVSKEPWTYCSEMYTKDLRSPEQGCNSGENLGVRAANAY
ncbi:hypothetical protein Anapl_00571 [Anas platyrhynchos]|uniref:Uncharacterized protein n=1 Tax=Anas platyrhynchos TaxID=8839 RepID=R0K746_ANAPL|nr:hypothetical protein Anapl_00571 [Anas platyrhynchos]